MEYNNSPEYETAQSRISTLLAEIGEQLTAINSSHDVDGVIAEQDKSGFIFKQSELIYTYISRENLDERDAYIAKLEEELTKAKNQAKAENERWYKEYLINQQLKSALKSLTAVLVED
ncbi:MAG: hypothetical protein NC453_29810 [Muribaculum sp.]|nr:hypothetical protein [Muribaculum sp.]